MATLQKFNSFMAQAWQGKFAFNQGVANLNGATNYTYKCCLSNTLVAATNVLYQDIVEIAATGGYVLGGKNITANLTIASGVTNLIFGDVSWTAVGGSIGPFQYAVYYVDQNDALNLPATSKYLVGYIDNGSPILLAASQAIFLDADQVNGALQYTS